MLSDKIGKESGKTIFFIFATEKEAGVSTII